MIYLDSAATTPIDPDVIREMMPYLTTQYGNAGALYKLGRQAGDAVYGARKRVADLICCIPEQVLFTSGGSESNNFVFHGLKNRLKTEGKKHILVSAVEHDSVLKAAETLRADGFDVDYIPVTKYGCVNKHRNIFMASALELCDYVVDGPYIDSERDITIAFRGSRNQRIIDVKKTLQDKRIIETQIE